MTMDNVNVALLERLTKLADIADDLLDEDYKDSRLVLTTRTHVAVAYWDPEGAIVLRVQEQPHAE
jgi:hypothetical protein